MKKTNLLKALCSENMQNKLRNVPLWAAVLALIYLIAKNWFGIDIPGWADISSQIIAILTILLGQANSSSNKFGL